MNDAVQKYILKSERNLGIAAAVGEAWPQARRALLLGFIDRLDSRLKKKLKGWHSWHDAGDFFLKSYPGYDIWKPAWEDQYSIRLECNYYGTRMVLGLARELNNLGKRPHCADLFEVFKREHSAAISHKWWEARITLQSPAPDWRKPEVLWQMHKDKKFLEDVAQQCLDMAKLCEPVVDRYVRKRR